MLERELFRLGYSYSGLDEYGREVPERPSGWDDIGIADDQQVGGGGLGKPVLRATMAEVRAGRWACGRSQTEQ